MANDTPANGLTLGKVLAGAFVVSAVIAIYLGIGLWMAYSETHPGPEPPPATATHPPTGRNPERPTA